MTSRTLLPLLAALVLFLLAMNTAAAAQPTQRQATVDHVADDDTIQVGIRGHQEDVRLIGIDTPEVYFGAECGGPEASAAIKRMLKPGDRVRLIRDRSQANRDRFGRLLRYVELAGRDLGRKQIRKGWAEVYVFEDPFHRGEAVPSCQRIVEWIRCRSVSTATAVFAGLAAVR